MGGYADEVSLKLTTRDEMSAKLRDARKELRTIEKQMVDTRKQVQDTGSKEAAAELAKLEKQWEEVSHRQRDAAKSLTEAKKALAGVTGEAKDAAKAVEKVGTEAKSTAQATDRLTGETKQLTKASKDSGSAQSGLSHQLGRTALKVAHLDGKFDRLQKTTKGADTHLGKMGLVAGAAVAGGVAAAAAAAIGAGKAIASMTQSAMEDEAGQKKLAGQLKNTTGATGEQVAKLEDWISKQGELTGFADDRMRPALARLADSFGSIGKAKDMTALAMDIATAKGKDLSTVSAALAKANDGQVGALKKLGITLGPQAENMNDYNIAQRAQLKLQEKAQEALDAYGPKSKQYGAAMAKVKDGQKGLNEIAAQGTDMFGELGKKFGGQTSTHAKTLEGRVARLKLIFSETKESIGGAFIPVLTKAFGWIQDKAIPVVRQLAAKLMPKLREGFKVVTQAIEDNRPGLKRVGIILGAIGKVVIEKVVPAFAKLQFKAWAVGIKVIGTLGNKVMDAAPGFLRFAGVAVHAFRAVADAGMTTMESILQTAARTMGWIPGIGPKIRKAADAFSSLKEKTHAALTKTEKDLRKAADGVERWNAKAKKAEAAKLRGNIKDLEDKISSAKKKLSDPKLTKPEKTKLNADIHKWQRDVATAKKDLKSIPATKSVTISVHGTKIKTEADKATKLLGVLNKINGMNARYKVDGGYSGGVGGGGGATGPSHTGYTRPVKIGHANPNWTRYRSGKWHGGTDIGVPPGTAVHATSNQRVRYVKHLNRSYGYHILATDGVRDYLYAHLSSTDGTHANQYIGKNKVIGYSGSTGHSSGPHLHYEVRPAGRGNGSAINPLAYMAGGGRVRGAGTGTSDQVPLMGSNGEFMIREAAARAIGYDRLEQLNRADRMPALPPVVNVAAPRVAQPQQGMAPLVGTMVVQPTSQIDFELGLAREARRQARERATRYAEAS